MAFAHLHAHTEHSYLDGVMKVADYVARVKELGQRACAITDHGGMHGVIRFFKACRKAGIHPVIGCELYVVEDPDVKDRQAIHHLVALAKDLEGYRNLMELSSCGYAHFWHKPRVPLAFLAAHAGHLVGMSACLGGEIPKIIRKGLPGWEERAAKAVRRYQDIFDGDFHLEFQDNGYPEQPGVNRKLVELSLATGAPCVATNDCHYLYAGDKALQDRVTRIAHKDAAKSNEAEVSEPACHVRSEEEMARFFPKGHLEATVAIADRCQVEIPLGRPVFPGMDLGGETPEQALTRMSAEGLARRGFAGDAQYEGRLAWELDQIIVNGFATYLLIVADFIRAARDKGIMVGPGRGSAAGSLACYCLEITDIDPLLHGLYFERFINPDRVSLPDIDVDFCERRRGEAVAYMTRTYGADRVAQICNISSMQAKMAIKDMARSMKFDGKLVLAEKVAALCAMLPQSAQGETGVLARAVAAGVYDEAMADPLVKELLDTAVRVEGLSRNTSTHAAGVVVADTRVLDYAPTFLDKTGKTVTQYDKNDVEAAGLVKIDFLGLRNMTTIQSALALIGRDGLPVPDMRRLPLDDAATFALYRSGDMDGVFQMESPGMRKYLSLMRPDKFSDLTALVALFRPGPLQSGLMESYMSRRAGLEVADYFGLPELLAPVLDETYGVIVYQEQVMNLARVVCGFTLAQADILRKAMGKKLPEVMARQREAFVSGTMANATIDPDEGKRKEKAEELFSMVEKFAAYGFNKSHSAAYAYISYQTAYLKANYPAHFWTALLEAEKGDTAKLGAYVVKCRRTVPVLPPDVLRGTAEFSLADGAIRFGLSAIKGLPDKAVASLVALQDRWAREGSPASLARLLSLSPDFGSKFLETLAKAGALDSYCRDRARLLANLPLVLERAKKLRKAFAPFTGRASLCPLPEPAGGGLGLAADTQEAPAAMSAVEVFRAEREVVGFYVSTGHPLAESVPAGTARRLLVEAEAPPEGWDGKEALPWQEFYVEVGEVVQRLTKKGNPFLTGEVSDESGQMRFACFGPFWKDERQSMSVQECMKALVPDALVRIEAEVQVDRFLAQGGEDDGPPPLQLLIKVAEAIDAAGRGDEDGEVVIQVPKARTPRPYKMLP
jgi:DNA polymerase-3 subunit alpha